MDNLYIVMPAYNEEETIEDVIRVWYPIVEKLGEKSRLVIVNDGSKDKTEEILKKYEEQYPKLVGLTKPNGGHGAAVLYGYQYAIDQGCDYIFQTDSDGQTLPEEFPIFWKNREQCGLLIGHRKGRQDGFSRTLVTRVLRMVILTIFHVWIWDANTPYRLMKREELTEVLEYVPENCALANVIVSVIYKKQKRGIWYSPITFRPRQGGTNSINIKRIFKIGRDSLIEFYKINKRISK